MKVDLDFTNVKSSQKVRVPEGDYVVKCVKVAKGKSANKGTPQITTSFKFLSGDGAAGKTIHDNHYLTENSLWTLRNMLEALGYNVPAGKMTFNSDMVMNKKVGITVIDGEEYRGRISSEIADYIPANVVGNKTSSDDSDGLDVFAPSDEDEEDDEQEDEFSFEDDEEEDDEEVDWDDEEEDEEEEAIALSFDASDVESAKGSQLKEYYTEATEAGFELELPKKAKVSDVRAALTALFEEEEEEDDNDDMEEFDLDDMD